VDSVFDTVLETTDESVDEEILWQITSLPFNLCHPYFILINDALTEVTCLTNCS
jgi:hypothetical protein